MSRLPQLTRLGLFLVTGAAVACAHRAAAPAELMPGEVRGLFISGFETSLFRPCGSPFLASERVRLDSVPAQVMAAHRHVAGIARSLGREHEVYYVRWIMRDLPPSPPPPEGHVRIDNSPKRAVARVLEVRTPHPHECGWTPGGEIADPAP